MEKEVRCQSRRCGRTFMTTNLRKKYCSEVCGGDERNERRKGERKARHTDRSKPNPKMQREQKHVWGPHPNSVQSLIAKNDQQFLAKLGMTKQQATEAMNKDRREWTGLASEMEKWYRNQVQDTDRGETW